MRRRIDEEQYFLFIHTSFSLLFALFFIIHFNLKLRKNHKEIYEISVFYEQTVNLARWI